VDLVEVVQVDDGPVVGVQVAGVPAQEAAAFGAGAGEEAADGGVQGVAVG